MRTIRRTAATWLIGPLIVGLLMLTGLPPSFGAQAQAQERQTQGIVKTGRCEFTLILPGSNIEAVYWTFSDGWAPPAEKKNSPIQQHCLPDPMIYYTVTAKVTYDCRDVLDPSANNEYLRQCKVEVFSLSTYGTGEYDSVLEQVQRQMQSWINWAVAIGVSVMGLIGVCLASGLCERASSTTTAKAAQPEPGS